MPALHSEVSSQAIPSGLSWVVIRLWSMEFEGLLLRLDFDSLSLSGSSDTAKSLV